MNNKKSYYTFNWGEIMRFSDPSEKALEGTEKGLLFQDWGYPDLDFEFHVIYTYVNARCLGRPAFGPGNAREVAVATMTREMDIRSFDGFSQLKDRVYKTIDNCPPEKMEEIMYRACAILAQRGHFPHVPEKWQPFVAEHCSFIAKPNS